MVYPYKNKTASINDVAIITFNVEKFKNKLSFIISILLSLNTINTTCSHADNDVANATKA